MKILFTADLHSSRQAFEDFVRVLDGQHFDVGVVAGDLTEGSVDRETLLQLFDLTDDDFLPELHGPDLMMQDLLLKELRRQFGPDSLHQKALELEEQELKSILHKTRKSVFVLTGNHDRTSWKSEGNVVNLHSKVVKFRGFTFVGVGCGKSDTGGMETRKLYGLLQKTVNRSTVLVTHIPAWGILDRSDQGELLGDKMLRKIVDRRRPKVHLFGHVHETAGVSGRSVNGAFPLVKGFFSMDLVTNTVRLLRINKEVLYGAA